MKILACGIRLLSFCLLVAATAAQAQLLSNLANADGGSYGPSPDSGSIFTTGTAQLSINRVDVQMSSAGLGGNRVGFFTDAAGAPSTTQVGGFLTNAGATTIGIMSYTGAAVVLAPATTYWMVYDTNDGAAVTWTPITGAVAAPATGGATMTPGSVFGDYTTGAWVNDGVNLKFALFGVAGAPAAVAASPIPTTSEWALILLALMMAGTAIGFRPKQRD